MVLDALLGYEALDFPSQNDFTTHDQLQTIFISKANCALHAHLAHSPCGLQILIRSWSLGETLNDFVNLTEAHLD
jgi:hypothetical protein